MRPRSFDDPYLTIHAGAPLDRPDIETALRRLTPAGWDAALRRMKAHLDRRDAQQQIRHVRVRAGGTLLVWEVGAEETGPVSRALLAVAHRTRDGSRGIQPTVVMARIDPVMKIVHRNPDAIPALDALDAIDTAVPDANPPDDGQWAQSPEALLRIIENLETRLARQDADAPCPRHAIVRYERGAKGDIRITPVPYTPIRKNDKYERGAKGDVRITHYYMQSRYAPETPLIEAWLATCPKEGKGMTSVHKGRLTEALGTLPREATVTSISGRIRGKHPDR